MTLEDKEPDAERQATGQGVAKDHAIHSAIEDPCIDQAIQKSGRHHRLGNQAAFAKGTPSRASGQSVRRFRPGVRNNQGSFRNRSSE